MGAQEQFFPERRGAAAARPSAADDLLVEKLGALSTILSKSLDLERMLNEVLARCLAVVGSSKGAAYLFESDGGLALRANFGYPHSAKGGLAKFFGHADWLLRVAQGDEPVGVPSASVAEEPAAQLLARANAKSILMLPIALGNEHLGVLVMVSAKPDLAESLPLFTAAVRLQLGHIIALARAHFLLASSERRFRDLVQDLDAIVWEADVQTWKFSFVSRRAEEILGYPVEQWLTEPDFWANHLHPDDRERVLALCREATGRGKDHEFEYRAVAADGRVVWLRDIVRVVRSEDDCGQQLRGLMVDVTKAKEDEKKLEERTTHLNALIENSPLAIVVVDSEHRVQLCNPAFEHLFLYRLEEIAGSNLDEFIAPEDRRAEPAEFTRRALAGKAVHVATRRRRKDGTSVDVELHGVPLLVRGKLIGAIGLYQNISERKQAEQARRRSEADYRSLVQGAPYGIYRSSADGRFLAVNPALVAMLGYDAEAELLDVDMATEIYHDPGERARLVEQYRNQERFEGVEVQWRRKDGTPIRVRLSGRPVRGEKGEIICFEGIVENITERRVLEEQLRQAQKMEAVGRLAGGIAHDFNNLLMLIKGYSELLLDDIDQKDLRRYRGEVHDATERAVSLIKQLLAFSRKQVLQPVVFDLNTVVGEMEKLLPRLLGEHIQLITRLDPGLGHVKADPNQLEQVILNLAVNARDAMPQGGRLILETKNIELDHDYARQHPAVSPAPYVVLAVSDTGTGIDAETRAHIFEPFFTTKEKGKGTGLGLATVYGIVKQSGGHIWVYSEPGRGTTFKVYLPRVEQPLEASGASKPRAEAPRGWETVLLVEDEGAVRTLTREFLESSGYTVLEARSGDEALEVARRQAGPIHLLMTDAVMPGMSGRELAERLLPLRRETKVLYVSGYTDDAIVHHGVLPPGSAFLQKPFGRDTLAVKVREVLESEMGR